MPITRQILEQNRNATFVETGTFKGDALALARSVGFTAFWSCDIAERYTQLGRDKGFENVLTMPSPEFLAKVLPGIEGPITFWLDAHPCLKPMDITLPSVPILQELMTIKEHASDCLHTILIDDLRVMSDEHKALLKSECAMLWPGCEITTADDTLAPDDIMVVKIKGAL